MQLTCVLFFPAFVVVVVVVDYLQQPLIGLSVSAAGAAAPTAGK